MSMIQSPKAQWGDSKLWQLISLVEYPEIFTIMTEGMDIEGLGVILRVIVYDSTNSGKLSVSLVEIPGVYIQELTSPDLGTVVARRLVPYETGDIEDV